MNKLLSTYDLTQAPFGKHIPASEMFETDALSQALERLKAALEARSSAVVTGDSGCGKTCLLRLGRRSPSRTLPFALCP